MLPAVPALGRLLRSKRARQLPGGGLFSMHVMPGHLAAACFRCTEHAEKEEEGWESLRSKDCEGFASTRAGSIPPRSCHPPPVATSRPQSCVPM